MSQLWKGADGRSGCVKHWCEVMKCECTVGERMHVTREKLIRKVWDQSRVVEKREGEGV